MKFTIEIKDPKQQARIDRLRGKMEPRDFILRALEAGINLAEQNVKARENMIKFSPAKQEFKTLDVAQVTEALKDNDPKHPVRIEVSRLVKDYTEKLRAHAKANGNRLPNSLKVQAHAPIERVAFQITAEAINKAVDKINKSSKKAAGK